MENLQLIVTEDGSHSIYNKRLDENYHSRHGAVQESRHVFIEAGLLECSRSKSELSILEVGFGTGLNCFLTFLEAQRSGLKIHYTAFEPWPLNAEMVEALNYSEQLNALSQRAVFRRMHATPEGSFPLGDTFTLSRYKEAMESNAGTNTFDLIYFDAFAPDVQPELWTETVFSRLAARLLPGGVLVTYCAKGEVKRSMKKAGLLIERLPGPPGKREMTRARKP
jgi:tRNA U34 5-methylaminomethyl-2-thiouridine-forming methyltransferase MnmC